MTKASVVTELIILKIFRCSVHLGKIVIILCKSQWLTIVDGVSGSEMLFLHCMDEFLGLDGTGRLYHAMIKHHKHAMPKQLRAVLESLRV